MTEIFELTYHGGGGFTYSEVWNMDVPKRRFNLKKINEHLEKIEELRNKEQNKITEKSDPKKFEVPDFVKKAPKTRNVSTNTNPETQYVSKINTKK